MIISSAKPFFYSFFGSARRAAVGFCSAGDRRIDKDNVLPYSHDALPWDACRIFGKKHSGKGFRSDEDRGDPPAVRIYLEIGDLSHPVAAPDVHHVFLTQVASRTSHNSTPSHYRLSKVIIFKIEGNITENVRNVKRTRCGGPFLRTKVKVQKSCPGSFSFSFGGKDLSNSSTSLSST